MRIQRNEWPILCANVLYIVGFGTLAATRANYEFVIYGLGIVGLFALIFFYQRRVEFTPFTLWALTLWGCLHMAGGNLFPRGIRLYDVILVGLIPKHSILKYDQFVHLVGFAAATLVGYHLLRAHLRPGRHRWLALSMLIALVGMGFGALNEVVEFFVVLTVPESGVGGYANTGFDLVFNMLGALLAVGFIHLQRLRQDRDLPLV
ncbi:MAG: DUF2238 domain-containing protein [Candidatus Brocadiia bacterium]